MPFDIQLAIANLDFNKGLSYADRPDLSVLRARYPEIGFVFDRLEDLQELQDGVATQIKEAEEPLQDEIDELNGLVHKLRSTLEHIKDITVDVEITNIIEDVL
jgi:hypothetical protein